MKRATEYEAHDGKRFATREECKRHEMELNLSALAGLTEDQIIMAAIDGTDIKLAEAIEFAGKLIAQNRRASGRLKRTRKATSES